MSFEGDFLHLQHIFMQLFVIGSAFMPNSLINLNTSDYTKFITSEIPLVSFFFNVIAHIVEFTIIQRLLRWLSAPKSDAHIEKMINELRLATKTFSRGIYKSISDQNGC